MYTDEGIAEGVRFDISPENMLTYCFHSPN